MDAIVRRALLVLQNPDQPVYLLALTPDEIDQVADISRVTRDDEGKLLGYQRAEVKQHVDGIVDYLDSENPLMPNAIVLALSSNVQFKRSRGPNVDDGVVAAGSLEIPLPANEGPKPAWIVDGQQRSLALRRSKNRSFPIPVAAFVADTVALQRDQFVRVNNSKPLPSGLVTELLPEISAPISPRLSQRKLPSALVDQLNQAEESPLKGLIRRPSMSTSERKAAVITDTSLVKGLEEALRTPASCLFPYRNIASGETDIDGIWAVLICYWSAVRDVFPDAWGLPPAKSRLMHGVGIRSMFRLMDRVMATIDPNDESSGEAVREDLRRIADLCHWTSGSWTEMDGAGWNSLQNTPKDIRTLSNHLVRLHFQARSE